MFPQPDIVGALNDLANTSAARLLMATQGGAGACKAIVATFENVPATEL
jgi:hypothetical protein